MNRRPSLCEPLLLAAALCITPPPASGLNAAPASEDAVRLPAFSVSESSTNGYAANNSISATKVATELSKMPVSIDVLTEQLFKDYGLT